MTELIKIKTDVSPKMMPIICFFGAMFAYAMLFAIVITALFVDPTLAPLKAISWAIDTADHRLYLILFLFSVLPVFSIIAFVGLREYVIKNGNSFASYGASAFLFGRRE